MTDTATTATRSPQLALAAEAIAHRRYGEAEYLVRRHMQAHPDDPEGLRLLAQIAASAGHMGDAEQLLRKAIAIAPSFAAPYSNLANLLQGMGRGEEVIALLSDVVERQPRDLWALSMKSAVLMAEGRTEDALRTQEALLEREPRPYAWARYGYQLKALGRFADAARAYREALRLDPANGHAWWSLAALETAGLTSADIALMEAAVGSQPDEERETQLRFALGKALGDAGRYQESFVHYAAGNEIRGRGMGPDHGSVNEGVERAEALFTPAFLRDRAGSGCAAADPIFVLGMPRSGSTLVEQILASHPSIEGVGERGVLEAIAARIAGADASGWSWIDGISTLSPHDLHEFGRGYLHSIRRSRHSQRPFFTDKAPRNWQYIGLILLILPNARIIDIRRHPMACCLSNFCLFLSPENNLAASLEGFGHYYRDYVRMLAHFDRVAPGRIHRVHYEDLVEDPERETRALLEYLGLPFDASCLRFYDNDRPVHTPSVEQVRKPVHRERLERWRNYEPWLGPLKQALGPVLDDYRATTPP